MKKNKIFIDTDVLLDIMLERQFYCEDAKEIISLCENNEICGYTSSFVIANIHYIVSKIKNSAKADKVINQIRSIIKILPLTDKEISESMNSEFKDFEDGIQYFIAVNNNITCFITRNIKDFKNAVITVLSPKEYLKLDSVEKESNKIVTS